MRWIKCGGRLIVGSFVAWLLFVGGVIVIVVIDTTGADNGLRIFLHGNIPGFWRLEGSQRLVTDLVIGLAVGAHIWAFPCLGTRFHVAFLRIAGLCRYLAGFSFTLYLFHRPFTQVGGLMFPNTDQSIARSLVAAIVIIGFCLVISYATERQLGGWRCVLTPLLRAAEKRGGRCSPPH